MNYKFGLLFLSSSLAFAQNIDKEFKEFHSKYNSKEFEYIDEPIKEKTKKDNIDNNWLSDLLERIFDWEWKYIFYTIIGIVLIIMIYQMYKNGFFLRFSSNNKIIQEEESFDYIEKNLLVVDLVDLIEKAKTNGDYRLAVRYYHYLNSQNLAKKELIKWDPKKTNLQLINEIKSTKIKELFQNNTAIFNQVWFGNFELNEENFRTFEANFKFLNEAI